MVLQILGFVAGFFAVLNVLLVISICVVSENRKQESKNIRSALRSLAIGLGFEYSKGWSGEIYISYPYSDNDKLPASRADVERFFIENDKKLTAVYKHLGIQVEQKSIPPVPARTEVIVSKAPKN